MEKRRSQLAGAVEIVIYFTAIAYRAIAESWRQGSGNGDLGRISLALRIIPILNHAHLRKSVVRITRFAI